MSTQPVSPSSDDPPREPATEPIRGQGRTDEGGDWLRLGSVVRPQASELLHAPSSPSFRDRPTVATSSFVTPAATPANVGHYRIVRELGRGGMGVVYEAFDAGLKRSVALKMILAAEYADGETLARFHTEAEAVARLQHPNIVQVHEIGQQDGKPFLALEFVGGGTLAARIRSRPQPPLEAAALVRTLAEAIHFAHKQGIIHRDLKPANILLSVSRDAERSATATLGEFMPKITDFGLAKDVGDWKREDVGDAPPAIRRLTRSGDILGTPDYMAPEQIDAQVGPIGPAVDVYALGAILYELLTGRPPFAAATPLDALLLVINREAVSPSQLQPGLPRDLTTICLKCLDKEPAKRYASAAALADDLGRLLRGEPIRARPAGAVERTWKWARRRPVVAALLMGIVLVALLGFTGISWEWYQAEAAREREEDQRRQAELARDKHEVARREAETQKREAEAARDHEAAALYFSRIALAQRAYEKNDIAAADVLLEKSRPESNRPDLRSWEWHYLAQLCHAELHSFRADSDWAWSAAYSPDGRLLVTATGSNVYPLRDPAASAGTLKIWDARSGAELAVLEGHTGIILSAVFSPDGRWLLSTSADGTARLWDVATREELWQVACVVYNATHGYLWSERAVFAPDGRTVALGALAGVGSVVDVATGQVRDSDLVVGYSADGRRRAEWRKSHELVVTDLTTGQAVTIIRFEVYGGHTAFSPDGRRLLVEGELWDAVTGKHVAHLSHGGAINGVAVSQDGAYFATACADQAVRVWNADDGALIRELRGHGAGVLSVAFHPDGLRLVSTDQHGSVKVWDLTSDPAGVVFRRKVENYSAWIGSLCFSPDNRHLLTANDNANVVETWDPVTGRAIQERNVPISSELRYPRADTVFSADGRWLAGPKLMEPAQARIWDAITGQERQALTGGRMSISAMALSNDGGRAAAGGTAAARVGDQIVPVGELQVWDAASGQRLWYSDVQRGLPISALALSPDSKLLAYAVGARSRNGIAVGPVVLVEAATGRQLFRWSEPGGHNLVHSLAFSPDGHRVAAGALDGWVWVWDTTTGRAALQPLQGALLLTNVTFSPDGKRLAAAGVDGLVRLWDAATGEDVLTLRGFASQRPADLMFTARAAFSHDGTRLASLNWDGTLNVWGAVPADWEAKLQDAERRTFAWHLRQAQINLGRNNPFAVAFHRERIRRLDLTVAAERLERADLSAKVGQWDEAAADYAQLSETPPNDGYDFWFQHACLRLEVGDIKGYRNTCQIMRDRFGSSSNWAISATVAHACALAPDAIGDPAAVVDMATKRLAKDSSNKARSYLVLGLAHYRAGEYQLAESALKKGLEVAPDENAKVANWLVLAMTCHRMNQEETARKWLGQSEQWFADQAKNRPKEVPNGPPATWAWCDWLWLQHLRREAEALIPGADKPQNGRPAKMSRSKTGEIRLFLGLTIVIDPRAKPIALTGCVRKWRTAPVETGSLGFPDRKPDLETVGKRQSIFGQLPGDPPANAIVGAAKDILA